MDYKVRGNQLKIRVKQDDLPAIAWALAYPIFMKFVNDNPSKALTIVSFALELRGEIFLTLTSSGDPEALVVGESGRQAKL
jgi:hypothetical protein